MARFIDIASGYPLELPCQRMTLGTAPDNTVPIAEGFGVSARHFQITPVPGGNVLADLTGQQATLVNDQPVTQTFLKNGDLVTAGRLKLRYESQPVPPPLPPEDPVPDIAGPAGAPVDFPAANMPLVPRAQGYPGAARSGAGKSANYVDGGKTFLPNRATAIHLYKWMLPVMGIILWLGKWGYGFYRASSEMNDAEITGAAYELVETYRYAHDAKAPLIENIRDPERLVRMLLKGVNGSGEDAEVEFKAWLEDGQAEDALEMLTWKEGIGLTFKDEYREHRPLEDDGETGFSDSEAAGAAVGPDEI